MNAPEFPQIAPKPARSVRYRKCVLREQLALAADRIIETETRMRTKQFTQRHHYLCSRGTITVESSYLDVLTEKGETTYRERTGYVVTDDGSYTPAELQEVADWIGRDFADPQPALLSETREAPPRLPWWRRWFRS